MRGIVTVLGRDRVGIIAEVCSLLASHGVNVLDISQTVLREYFTMIMLVDVGGCGGSFVELTKILSDAGEQSGLVIRAQREEIFNAMHKI